MAVKMIDISSNNHTGGDDFAWNSVFSAGYRVVIIKATEGTNYVNPWIARDAAGAHKAGLKVGYYHFAHPSYGAALNQANYALEAIHGFPNDLGLVLDLERQEGMAWDKVETWAQNFLARIAQEKITSPVYLNPAFMEQMPKAPFGHKLWLASWGVKPRVDCWAWQEGQQLVPGIPGNTDFGLFYG